jgi:hypothetical protein
VAERDPYSWRPASSRQVSFVHTCQGFDHVRRPAWSSQILSHPKIYVVWNVVWNPLVVIYRRR